MMIGIDFDNTIVCYDKAFYLAAIEKNIDAWIDKPFNVDAILSQIKMIK